MPRHKERPQTRRHLVRSRLLDAVHLPITLYLGFVGVVDLLERGAVDRAVHPALAFAWAAALLGGAVFVLWGVAAEHSRTESVGHVFHLFGLGLLAAVSIAREDFNGLIPLAVLVAVALLRMRVLRRSRVAREVAADVVNGGELS